MFAADDSASLLGEQYEGHQTRGVNAAFCVHKQVSDCVLKTSLSFRNPHVAAPPGLPSNGPNDHLRDGLRWSAPCEVESQIVEIHYSDRDHIGDGRTRAYAHYRVFEAFRCVASQVRTVDVWMGRDRRAGYPVRVTCTVSAALRDGERIEVTATGDWPYAAIQQAATRARQQLDGTLMSCAK